MKQIFRVAILTILPALLFAQSPEQMNYQGVARDNGGTVLANQNISLRLSVLSGSITGAVEYSETQDATTSAIGLFNVQVGDGFVVSGSFAGIDWANDSHFMKVEMDASGGSSYTLMGTSQLLSVPYAMYAAKSGSGWGLTGNAGTVDGTDFIGTTDAAPFNIRVNNQPAGKIAFGLGTFYGLEAGNSSTSVLGNTAIGTSALYLNTVGYWNTAIGASALLSNSNGVGNTATGTESLLNNTNGGYNTATGVGALGGNTSGGQNTATGALALLGNSTGEFNTATGSEALRSNSSGEHNTASGFRALYSNTTGNSNTAFGYQSLYTNTTGTLNVAMGIEALYSNLIGNENVAIGYNALNSNIAANGNTAVGYNTLVQNTGGWNTAIGRYAMYSNTTGFLNTAIGNNALTTNGTGDYNTATGRDALSTNYSGDRNTASGDGALKNNVGGNNNSAVGAGALHWNTGNNNTALGYYALNNNTTGFLNTAVGHEAMLNNWTGNYNTALGRSANSVGTAYDNTLGMGDQADPTASNTVHVGNQWVTSIKGQVGFTTYSDARFKKNVLADEVKGLEFITKLEPVTYNYDTRAYSQWKEANYGEKDDSDWERKYDIENIRFSGFLAQDVERIANEVGYDFSGVDAPKNDKDSYGLRYAEFVVPLVKGMQEQQLLIEALQKQNELMQKEIELLKSK